MVDFSHENEIFLVFAELNRISFHLVNHLLEKGKHVRLVVKDKQEAEKLFACNINLFESLIECDVLSHDNISLERVFDSNIQLNKKVAYVFSVLSDVYKFAEDAVKLTRHIIDAIKKLQLNQQIERFVQISSSNVSKPSKLQSILKNIRFNYILYYKYKAEKLFRESGIRYLIIRPSNLYPGDVATAFTLDQGDRLEGYITPATVGKLAVDTALDHWVFPNTTYECSSIAKQMGQPYTYIQSQFNILKEDNIESLSKREIDHVTPVRAMKVFVMMFLGAAVYSMYNLTKSVLKKKKLNINLYA